MSLFKFIVPISFFMKIVSKVKSLYYTSYKDKGKGKILFGSSFQTLKIYKGINSKIELNGHLILTPFFEESSLVSIVVGKNAKLIINGDFKMGGGVKIIVADNAELVIGGKFKSTESGITGNTIIMVKEKVDIGKDFICSWNVFISDSDWHPIVDSKMTIPVHIADNVWISNNCNILKGSIIGEGSILGSNTKTSKKLYPECSLIVGENGKIIRSGVKWTR